MVKAFYFDLVVRLQENIEDDQIEESWLGFRSKHFGDNVE